MLQVCLKCRSRKHIRIVLHCGKILLRVYLIFHIFIQTAFELTPHTASAADYDDFIPSNGIVEFAADSDTATIELEIANDDIVEVPEYLQVSFTVTGDGNHVGDLDCASVTIISEDVAVEGTPYSLMEWTFLQETQI